MAKKPLETPPEGTPDFVLGRAQAGLYIASAILNPESAEQAPVVGAQSPTLSFMLYWAWDWLRRKLEAGANPTPPSS